MSRRRSRFRIESKVPAVKKALKAATKRGLEDAGMAWHGDAVRVTPVNYGLLRASLAWVASGRKQHHGSARGSDGKVATSSYELSAPTGTVRLGTNVEYAVPVHEDLDARHEGGQSAKFIETPLRENRDKYMRLIERALKGES